MIRKGQVYQITPTGLEIGDDMTLPDWIDCGQRLWEIRTTIQWCVGDWLAFGEKIFGEAYAQAISVTQYSEQTLKNYASISRAFSDREYRGRYSLSHSHFEAVAAHDIPMEQKTLFLEKAIEHGFSREDLRAAVKSWRGANGLPVYGNGNGKWQTVHTEELTVNGAAWSFPPDVQGKRVRLIVQELVE